LTPIQVERIRESARRPAEGKPRVPGSIHQKEQKEIKMKKLLFVASYFVLAAGALSSVASAQDNPATSLSKLVQIVRSATIQYQNIGAATAAGYGPFLGCVSGSDHGAMGIHYVNGALLNGILDPTHPQALIYEPTDGQMNLVGVEFIVDAATWLKNNANPPILEGQTFQLVESPNRFNIPSFFELHVWAWRSNPKGSFMDWNDNVTCAGQ
jgi:hypothetical protein